jgi:hypothetical protein
LKARKNVPSKNNLSANTEGPLQSGNTVKPAHPSQKINTAEVYIHNEYSPSMAKMDEVATSEPMAVAVSDGTRADLLSTRTMRRALAIHNKAPKAFDNQTRKAKVATNRNGK